MLILNRKCLKLSENVSFFAKRCKFVTEVVFAKFHHSWTRQNAVHSSFWGLRTFSAIECISCMHRAHVKLFLRVLSSKGETLHSVQLEFQLHLTSLLLSLYCILDLLLSASHESIIVWFTWLGKKYCYSTKFI